MDDEQEESRATLKSLILGDSDAIPNSTRDPWVEWIGSHPNLHRLGDFELQRVVGRGGMGIVFLAHQVSLDRVVALKVLPGGLALDPHTRQRFQLEARLAASLVHPHIVPVYAVGVEQGVDYYAMQYIEGQSVSQLLYGIANSTIPSLDATVTLPDGQPGAPWNARPGDAKTPDKDRSDRVKGRSEESGLRSAVANEKKNPCKAPMPPSEVARIGFAIADALAAAHRQGIVHRDVKPSNILLDAQAKPFLSDFGLAHAEQDFQLTSPGTILGSLKYMSPEQLDPQGDAIDARCDVYGLGATLYEMLTLEPVVHGKNRNEVLRNLIHRSARPPRALNPAVPSDLNTIVVKALQPDRKERYATASDLASDLKAFLEGRPIAARSHSVPVRVARWVGRNPSIAALSAGLLLVLMLTTIAASIVAVRMSRLAQDQSEMLVRIEREKTRAESLSQLLIEAFRSPDPALQGRSLTVASMLQSARTKVLSDPTIDDAARGDLLDAIGQSLRGLGEFDAAADIQQECLELRQRTLGPDALPTLQSKSRLALARRDVSDLKTSIQLYEETLATLRLRFGNDHRDTMETMGALAMAYQDNHQLDRALPLHEESLRRRKANLGPIAQATLQAMNNLALWYQESDRLQEAYELHRETCDLRLRHLGERHPDSLQSMANLVGAMQDVGKLEDALPLQERTLQLHREVLGDLHPNTLINLNNTALFYGDLGRIDDTIALFEDVIPKMRAKLRSGHQDTLMAIGNLAYYYHKVGRFDDAIALGKERLKGEVAAHGPLHSAAATCHSLLGTCYFARYVATHRSSETSSADGSPSEDLRSAEEHLRAALAIRREEPSATWVLYREMSKLGEVLTSTKKFSEAEPLLVDGFNQLLTVETQIPAAARGEILADARRRVVRYFESMQQPEQAAAYSAK